MKTCVSSYSFNRLLVSGEANQFDLVRMTAELGFDAIEFAGITPHDGSTPLAYAAKLKALCAEHGLEIASYTIAADLLTGSGGDTEKEVQRLKAEADIAHALGAKRMRHDATSGYAEGARGFRSFDDALEILAPACRELSLYAATLGVRTMVENHGYFAQDSRRVEKLVSAVACDNFGCLCDIGNFLCADEDPVTAVGRVAPYAFHVHIKDFHVKSGDGPDPGEGFFPSRGGNYLRGAIVGHGVVPVAQCLRVLSRAGYDGFVSIEFEGLEDNHTALRIGLANLKRFIP